MSSKKFKVQYPKSSITDDFTKEDYLIPETPKDFPPPPDKQEYEAKLKKLEYEKKKGIVVDKAEIERKAFNLGRLLRDQLLSIPARLAPKVSAENNLKKVTKILEDECERCEREILRRMADL